jgi:hypothetical protein
VFGLRNIPRAMKKMAAIAESLQANGAVATHSRQQHTDGSAMPQSADALEKHVD